MVRPTAVVVFGRANSFPCFSPVRECGEEEASPEGSGGRHFDTEPASGDTASSGGDGAQPLEGPAGGEPAVQQRALRCGARPGADAEQPSTARERALQDELRAAQSHVSQLLGEARERDCAARQAQADLHEARSHNDALKQDVRRRDEQFASSHAALLGLAEERALGMERLLGALTSAWNHVAEQNSRANTPESPRRMMEEAGEAGEAMRKELQLLRLQETASRKKEAELQYTVQSLQAQLDEYKRRELQLPKHAGAHEQAGPSSSGGARPDACDEPELVAANAKIAQHTLATLVHQLSPAKKAGGLAGSLVKSQRGTDEGAERRKGPAQNVHDHRSARFGNDYVDDAAALRHESEEAARQARCAGVFCCGVYACAFAKMQSCANAPHILATHAHKLQSNGR